MKRKTKEKISELEYEFLTKHLSEMEIKEEEFYAYVKKIKKTCIKHGVKKKKARDCAHEMGHRALDRLIGEVIDMMTDQAKDMFYNGTQH
jgi:hypothetical protein